MRAQPEQVLAAHRAFVDAGASDLLTATLRCLPGVTPGWDRVRDDAIRLARAAGPERVWLSLGPGGDPAPVTAGAAVDGVVLETFVDPTEAAAAARAVRRVWDGPLVVCVVPRDGSDLPTAARALHDAGADALGLNCASVEMVARAVATLPERVPLWLKPNGGAPDHPAWDALIARARWIGGCCGASPAEIRRLGDRIDAISAGSSG